MLPDTLPKVRKVLPDKSGEVLLVGPIAIKANVSLQDAEEAMSILVDEGVLRFAGKQELRRDSTVLVFVKV